MTTRKNRRAVLAELLLLADPASVHTRGDGISLAVDFDRVAELRSWLDVAGLTGPDLLAGEHTGTTNDGRTYQAMDAFPTWHGWKIYAHAIEYTAAPLDADTADQLAALAVTA